MARHMITTIVSEDNSWMTTYMYMEVKDNSYIQRTCTCKSNISYVDYEYHATVPPTMSSVCLMVPFSL